MNTSSPHDAAARRRFDEMLDRILWLQLLEQWDDDESFNIQCDIEHQERKRQQLEARQHAV